MPPNSAELPRPPAGQYMSHFLYGGKQNVLLLLITMRATNRGRPEMRLSELSQHILHSESKQSKVRKILKSNLYSHLTSGRPRLVDRTVRRILLYIKLYVQNV